MRRRICRKTATAPGLSAVGAFVRRRRPGGIVKPRRFPAGTGLGAYKRLSLNVEAPAEEELPLPPPASQQVIANEALALQEE